MTRADIGRVLIYETRIVKIDLALYGIKDARYELWIRNLRDDPMLGTSKDGVNYEYLLDSYSLRYAVHMDRQGISLTITGIRPIETLTKTQRTVRALQNIAKVAAKIKEFRDTWKGGS